MFFAPTITPSLLSLVVIAVSVSCQALSEGDAVLGVSASGSGALSTVENVPDFSKDHFNGAKQSLEFIAFSLKHALETFGGPTYQKLQAPDVRENIYSLADSVKTRLYTLSDNINANDSSGLLGAAFAGQLLSTHIKDMQPPAGVEEDYQHLFYSANFVTMALDHSVHLFGGSLHKKLQSPDLQEKVKALSDDVESKLEVIAKGLVPASDLHIRGIFRRTPVGSFIVMFSLSVVFLVFALISLDPF